MAFIPDEAVLAMRSELTVPARDMYPYYCLRRNRKSGGFHCPAERVLAEMPGLDRRAYFRGKAELVEKGWITVQGDFVMPIKGFESDKNDTIFESKPSCSGDKNDTQNQEQSDDIVTESDRNDTPSDKNDTRRNSSIPANKPAITKELADADKVFDFWKETFKKTEQTKFGPKRRKAVNARLADYSVDELKDAIRGCSVDPFYRGQNESGKEFTDLALICRDETKVEGFIETWTGHQKAEIQGSELTRCDRCKTSNGYVRDSIKNGDVLCDHGEAPKTQPLSGSNFTDEWLEALAPVIGAGSSASIVNVSGWRNVIQTAVRDKITRQQFLDAARRELRKNKQTPQFFTPTGVLKALQTGSVSVGGFLH